MVLPQHMPGGRVIDPSASVHLPKPISNRYCEKAAF